MVDLNAQNCHMNMEKKVVVECRVIDRKRMLVARVEPNIDFLSKECTSSVFRLWPSRPGCMPVHLNSKHEVVCSGT